MNSESFVREARAFADDLQNASTPDDLTFIHNNYPNFSKSVATVDRQIRVHWRHVAERDFRPLVAIGDLLQRLGVASDLGRRLRKCGEEALENRDTASAVDLLKTITVAQESRHEPLRANKRETSNRLKFTLEGAGERSDGYARTPALRLACFA